MARRSGTADLPLHGGHVPPWLSQRMAALGRVICEAIAIHYGTDELLRRLSHPFWFQSFGAVMGMDWHSSGITTSVLGALKRGLAPVQDELGLYVCGGRGRHSRKTPDELTSLGDRIGLDADVLVRASKLVAKVDSAAVQDGFELYLHGFIVTRAGSWCVVQQGMRPTQRQARRYHWLSLDLQSFVDAPHAAIEGPSSTREIVNLTDARAERARNAQLELVSSGPDRVLRHLREVYRGNAALELFPQPQPQPTAALMPHLQMPAHHDVRASDVMLRRLHGTLAAAAERGPQDFAELLLTPGIGARTVMSLAMVAEVVHGAPCRFSDPARFSLAHGGKDGHPFPVPLRVYDETVRVLRTAVENAKLGLDDKLHALERLDRQARTVDTQDRAGEGERASRRPSAPPPAARPPHRPTFEQFVQDERAQSDHLGGRTVFDDRRKPRVARAATKRAGPKPGVGQQLKLPGVKSRG